MNEDRMELLSAPSRYCPVHLNIRGRACLVVGGGSVGERKVLRLLACGAAVRGVAVEVTPRLEQLARNGRVTLFRRQYRETDLEGVFLVFAATGNAELNRRIGEEARNRDILCNIADRPRDSDFISPAVVTRGDLMITVSTGGACPAYAKRVRESLEALFDRRIDEFLRLMRQIRNRLLQTHDPDAHKIMFTRLVESGLDQMIVSGDTEAAKRVLVETLGTDEDLNALEMSKV